MNQTWIRLEVSTQGLEDGEWKTLTYQQISATKLLIFSIYNGLIHIYNKIHSDPRLSGPQFVMCTGTKRATYGSDQALSVFIFTITQISKKTK